MISFMRQFTVRANCDQDELALDRKKEEKKIKQEKKGKKSVEIAGHSSETKRKQRQRYSPATSSRQPSQKNDAEKGGEEVLEKDVQVRP